MDQLCKMTWTISLVISMVALSSCRELVRSPWSELDSLQQNNAPIIGVLAQETSWKMEEAWPNKYTSYIAASYIKFVEGGGARAVPIWIGKTERYYESLLNKLNGVLLPGGGTFFNQTKGYAEAGEHIYRIAIKLNDQGVHLPIFGTCLGFEFLLYAANDMKECRVWCSSQRQSLPLEFTDAWQDSRLFGSAPYNVIDILQSEPVTANFHSFCVTSQKMTELGLTDQWAILSNNRDRNGLEFVSSIEHKRYPFFGVQFHPEKSLYEWIRNRNISHTDNAITAAQHFSNFLVNESRKNRNAFLNSRDESRHLIYNFAATFTAPINSTFEQSYLFTRDTDYPAN